MASSYAFLNDAQQKFLLAITSGNFKYSKYFKEKADDEVTAIADDVRKAGHPICHVFVKDEVPGHPPRWMTFYFMEGDDVWRYFGNDAELRFPSTPLKALLRNDEQATVRNKSTVPQNVSAEAVIRPKKNVVSYALLEKMGGNQP